jgi:hypothetical protein
VTTTYQGIMQERRGQEVTVVSRGNLLACRFPDGRVIGCAQSSVKEEESA